MKRLVSGLIPILVLLSCSDELQEAHDMAIAISNQSIPSPITEKTKVEKDIITYITKIKLGNISTFSNTNNNYSLTPYIYKGDTIMYIANYASGWDLYSADQRTPLVMASSETGIFDTSNNTMAPAFKVYLNSVAEELYQIKKIGTTKGETYGLWKTVSLQNDEVDKQMIKVDPRAVGTQPGEGHWVLLSTTPPVTSSNMSNRLTSTRWGQNSPWNDYVPFAPENMSEHSAAGCMAVAAAQYLYYLHYKNNSPTHTVTSATYQASSNTYNYTGSSSSIWNQMAKTSNSTGTDYAAILIGYAGKNINTNYHLSASEASLDNVISFINREGNYSYKQSNIDYTYITKELTAGRAVLAYAQSYNEASKKNEGHAFIIDRYRKTTTSSTSTFGWVGTDNLGQDSNDYDENGNIVGYSFFYDKDIETVSYDYLMNWGWNGSWDNTYCTASSGSDWNVGHHFNTNRLFVK